MVHYITCDSYWGPDERLSDHLEQEEHLVLGVNAGGMGAQLPLIRHEP